MKIDLRGLREQAGMTQTELARLVGRKQSDIVRFERDPDRIPASTLFALLDALGVNLGDLGDGQTARGPVDAGDPYWQLDSASTDLAKHAASRPDLADESFARGAATVSRLASRAPSRVRPVVGLFGGFDAGKSTLINALLGQAALGASYTPATSVVTYVRHVSARPEWLAEAVVVLRDGFNPDLWDDREHVQAHRIVAGDLDTLRLYGTHGGRHGDSGAGYALVFLDAPILRAATLVDLPGFENDATDTTRAIGQHARVDIALYLSPYNRFLRQTDVERLQGLVRKNPGAAVFVVASQATSAAIDDQALASLLEHGRLRLAGLQAYAAIHGLAVEQESRRAPLFRALHRELVRRAPVAVSTSAPASSPPGGGRADLPRGQARCPRCGTIMSALPASLWSCTCGARLRLPGRVPLRCPSCSRTTTAYGSQIVRCACGRQLRRPQPRPQGGN